MGRGKSPNKAQVYIDPRTAFAGNAVVRSKLFLNDKDLDLMEWDEIWKEFASYPVSSQDLLKMTDTRLYNNSLYEAIWDKYYMEKTGYLEILKASVVDTIVDHLEESFRADFRSKLEAILDKRDFEIWPEKVLLGFRDSESEAYQKSLAMAQEYIRYSLQVYPQLAELIEYWRSDVYSFDVTNSVGEPQKIFVDPNFKRVTRNEIIAFFEERHSIDDTEYLKSFQEIYQKASDDNIKSLSSIFDWESKTGLKTNLIISGVISEYLKEGSLENTNSEQHQENIKVAIKKGILKDSLQNVITHETDQPFGTFNEIVSAASSSERKVMLLKLVPFFETNRQEKLFKGIVELKGDLLKEEDFVAIIDAAVEAVTYTDEDKRLLEPHRQALKINAAIFDYLNNK